MKKIKVGTQEYPCRVTMGAMLRFQRESGKDVRELSNDNISDLLLFVWCCVKSACNADGVEFDCTFDRFADMLEPDGLNDFYEDMTEAQKKTAATPMK